MGFLAGDDDIYCMVCLEETDRQVLLLRWAGVMEEAGPPDLRKRLLAA
ncbi:MAG: hypothetical protein JOY71_15600 [Acetobacteraceae bacterium]|nr:hypothetical protein [Acetobacteraceae bacterium]MBV8523524.1 hypothetical protein [Acetobacteraceae bacterium]